MGADNTAAKQAKKQEEAARQAEMERQRRIREGTASINDAFSQFDDSYYGGIEQSALDYYIPEVNQQHDKALNKLRFQQARTGNRNSSAGASQIADLVKAANEARTRYADEALGLSQQSRADVEGNRNALLAQLSASADPSAASAAALSRAEALSAPPQFSAVSDLFSQYLNQGALALRAQNQGYNVFGRRDGQPTTANPGSSVSTVK